MIRSIKFKPVNWVDGMRLSSEQFVSNDQYYQDKIRDAVSTSLNPFHYGVLAHTAPDINAFDVEFSFKASNSVHIAVRYCHAITAEGYRIHIEPDQDGNSLVETDIHLNRADNSTVNSYTIVLCIDPSERIPEGELDAEIEPPRYPFVGPKYKIIVMPDSEYTTNTSVNGGVAIGKIIADGTAHRIDQQFIPPCVAMASHKLLSAYYNKFAEITYKLQDVSFTLLGKTDNEASLTVLGKSLRLVTEKMVYFLVDKMYCLRHQYRYAAPVDFIGLYASLGQLILSAMRSIPAKDRDDLLTYFYEWRDINPATFEDLLVRVIEIKFNQENSAVAFLLIEEFLVEVAALWERLAALDYIGQHKENIVVAEQQVVQHVQNKKIWTLLD